MKKQPKITFNIKGILSFIVLALISAVMLAAVFIALPYTEKLTDIVSFNLVTKDQDYWTKVYTVSVASGNKKEIEDTKEIIYKRLRDFGVERVNISIGETTSEEIEVTSETEETTEEGEEAKEPEKKTVYKTPLYITVTTTKDTAYIEPLVSLQYEYKVMTRKNGINFDDSSNAMAAYLEENYNKTDFDHTAFRSVYITKLGTSTGGKAYFVIFKPWAHKVDDLRHFLEEHAGDTIGICVNGMVYQYNVPDTISSNVMLYTSTYAENAEDVKELSALYNSGHIPVELTLEDTEDKDTDIVSINYIKVMLGFAAALIVVYLYMFIFKTTKRIELVQSLLTTVVAISLYISYLKITDTPIDSFILPIEAIITAILVKSLAGNRDSMIYIATAFIITLIFSSIWGTATIVHFSIQMIILTALSCILLPLTKWYINKVKHL